MSDNPVIRKLFHLAFLLKRPMTLGVRILATNSAGEILLVKHTYIPGWYLPGGGVETGESGLAAARKELEEETGYACTSELQLLGAYYNTSASKRDHVLLYRASEIQQVYEFKPNREIAEIGFFTCNNLPQDIAKGSAKRIQEHMESQPVSEYW